ncbi:MAG: hypothetical protein HQL93_11675 [Magnetococcales bacterium]|nr:hypothetical protein [Magnetococcales bacterium]
MSNYGSVAGVVEYALVHLDESGVFEDPKVQEIIRQAIEEAEQNGTPPREWNSAEVHARHQKQWEERNGKPWPL